MYKTTSNCHHLRYLKNAPDLQRPRRWSCRREIPMAAAWVAPPIRKLWLVYTDGSLEQSKIDLFKYWMKRCCGTWEPSFIAKRPWACRGRMLTYACMARTGQYLSGSWDNTVTVCWDTECLNVRKVRVYCGGWVWCITMSWGIRQWADGVCVSSPTRHNP